MGANRFAVYFYFAERFGGEKKKKRSPVCLNELIRPWPPQRNHFAEFPVDVSTAHRLIPVGDLTICIRPK